MSVRQSILAILDQGSSYGYRLRAEFERRTGSTWPINVGQIYNTLDRLERDGLIVKGDTDTDGHVFYSITTAGHDEVTRWLRSPVQRPETTRDELAIKLAVAVTLPGVDIAEIVRVQRMSTMTTLQQLTRAKNSGDDPESTDELAWLLVIDSLIFQAEAEIRWLDHSSSRLARAKDRGLAASEPLAEPRRRGRPARTDTPTTAQAATDGRVLR
ncbi:PadR family transcriptional regulator [Cryobacterium suzukii]|uniref:PadR family transcriptional regulator n=1 Tax=Cryobacterium suzukii TaxID=1259198 RepID=A0A4R9AJY5_9MICO|nr:PadR family transcriptional regulator [Cryobacterium suzukii]TFD62746.1 PadR family transcriptional regulator [Cryobacterium suzukii]